MLAPVECGAMGARGRAAFESRFNWKAMEARLLDAYPDRPVWILDGPSLTGGAYRIAAGPLSAAEAAASPIAPDAAGDTHVYDPVSPPPPPLR